MVRLVAGLLRRSDSSGTLARSESVAISYLRVLSVTAIVACHFLQYLDSRWAWVLNLGVQVFFFISGYLYGHKTVTDWPAWFGRRIRKIYVPFIIVVFAFTPLLFMADGNVSLLVKSIVAYITDTQWFWGGYSGLRHLWFISAIFFCYFITPILQALRRISPLLIMVVLGYGALDLIYLQYDVEHFSPLFIYAVGYLSCNVGKTMSRLLLVGFTVMAIAVVCRIEWTQIVDLQNFWSRLFHVFVGIAFSMLFIAGVSRIRRLRVPRVVHLLDQYSYPVYLVHHPLILGPLTLMSLTDHLFINISVIIVMIAVLAVLLNRLTAKVNSIITL